MRKEIETKISEYIHFVINKHSDNLQGIQVSEESLPLMKESAESIMTLLRGHARNEKNYDYAIEQLEILKFMLETQNNSEIKGCFKEELQKVE